MRRFCLAAFVAIFTLQSTATALAVPLPQTIPAKRVALLAPARKQQTIHIAQLGSPTPVAQPTMMPPALSEHVPYDLPTATTPSASARSTPPPMPLAPVPPALAARSGVPSRHFLPRPLPTAHTPLVGAQIVARSSTPVPVPTSPSLRPSSRSVQPLYLSSGMSTTGTTNWWTNPSTALPGIGTASVNVATGNLILSSTDIDIPERGINLTFRRFYNSQSNHTYSNADGSVPAQYGDGWTNNLDIHLGNGNAPGDIILYDATGAAFYFTASQSACLTPPPGVHDSLCQIGSPPTSYQWTRTDGTVHQFYLTTTGDDYAGRLQEIWGRNHNNYITLTYTFNGPAIAANLTQIVAMHSDTHSLTLSFQNVPGSGQELNNIKLPDGNVVSYLYHNSDLTYVCALGNNRPNVNTLCGTAPHLLEEYSYTGTNHQLNFIDSPQWIESNYETGMYQNYDYDSSNRITSIVDQGTVNPSAPQGSGSSPIQPAASPAGDGTGGVSKYWERDFNGYDSGTAIVTDTDTHKRQYSFDTTGRVTKVLACYSNCLNTDPNAWTNLESDASWDANNNLTETKDPRAHATDYAYDANGNLIAGALPPPSSGANRPTSLYSYDTNNNLLAVCDPVHSTQYDWVNRPVNDGLCTSSMSPLQFAWNAGDQNEPNGYLSQITTPLGYHYTLGYNTSQEGGGDYGLVTSITGDLITQNVSGAPSSIVPQAQFAYDGYGNAACSSQLTDAHTRWTRRSFDALNRPTQIDDPDDAALLPAPCSGAIPGLPGSHIITSLSYYMNGQLATSQSPSEYAAGGSSSYNYDADGNLTSETIPYATPAPTAQYFYDGADRLVEVETPADSTIDSGATGFTRYFYDLSQGLGHLTFSGESNWFYAYGNLYKVQRCLAAQGSNNCGSNWQDITAQASDPLDRPTALYAYQPGNTTAQQTTYAYDAGGNLGLLTSTLDPVGAASAMSYDWDDNLTSQTFGGPNPSSNRSYTYDADGRVLSASSLAGGTYTYTYYADGNVNTVQEPPVTGLTGQPLLRDSYYPNGWRQSLTINAPPAINNVQEFNYGYRADGLLAAESVANQGAFSASYTEAGRPLTLSDPFTGSNIANNQIKAHSFSYDANGQLSSELLPNGAPNANGGSYTNIAHTAEGDPSSYAITLPWYTAPNNSYVVQMNLSYNARDELVEQKATAQDGAVADNKYQDLFGHICPAGACGTIDPPTGALLSGAATTLDGCNGTFSLSYDVDGRLTGYTASESAGTNPNGDACNVQNSLLQDSRTYDTDSHTLSDNCLASIIAICNAANTTYSWAPTGAMSRYVTTPSGTSYGYGMHWDGNQLLFMNSDAGVMAQLDVGAVGVVTNPTSQTPNAYAGLTVFDRDFTQSLATRHQSGGADSWIVSNDAFTFNRFTGDTFQTVTGTYPGFGTFNVNNTVTSMARPDGYGLSTLIFQGVRAYDPFAMQWTSPDKYAGTTVAATQQSYTWNGNNPITNRDLSGYDSNSHNNGDPCDANGGEWVQQDDGSWLCLPPFPNQNDVSHCGGCGWLFTPPGQGAINWGVSLAPWGDYGPGARARPMTTVVMSCAVVVGGELVPPGCLVPPSACHLNRLPGALRNTIEMQVVNAVGAGVAAVLFSKPLTVAEALGVGGPISVGGLAAQVAYTTENAAFGGCPAGPVAGH